MDDRTIERGTPAHLIEELHAQKTPLIQEKTKLEAEYQGRIAVLDRQIAYINAAADVIEKALSPFTCKHCKGTGKLPGYDSSDSISHEICVSCHGTGIHIPQEDLKKYE